MNNQSDSTNDKHNQPVEALPEEFVSLLADEGTRVLHKWLVSVGAPKVVTDAIYEVDYLRHYEVYLWKNKVSETENESVKESIAVVATAIALLGGTFHGGGSISYPRKPISWQLPATLEGLLDIFERLSDEDKVRAQAWMRGLATAESLAVKHHETLDEKFLRLITELAHNGQQEDIDEIFNKMKDMTAKRERTQRIVEKLKQLEPDQLKLVDGWLAMNGAVSMPEEGQP